MSITHHKKEDIMKTILVSIVIALSSHFAFAEETKTETAPAATESHAAPATEAAKAKAATTKAGANAKGKMHAAMGAKHEEMMKMCKEMHPDMDCEKMMGSCSGKKDAKACMDEMASKTN
jgi:hypothetical protein